jgi:hypothetical protein
VNEEVKLFLLILIFLELFEFSWQKGTNFQEYVKNLFSFYNRGVILFILLHPTLYFVIFVQMYFDNFSLLATSITLIKVLDIGTKISFMDKLYNKKKLGDFEVLLKENYAIPLPFKMLGLILYPTLFFFAF